MEKSIIGHGIIGGKTGSRVGYFGWPSVAVTDDGTIIVVASGLRRYHVCPWGKTVLYSSKDKGMTWSGPEVVNDSPIDDRDAGVISLGENKFLISWFTSDTRIYREHESVKKTMTDKDYSEFIDVTSKWNDELVYSYLGSWIKTGDINNWGSPIRVPVTAPHGPIKLTGGDLLYLGKSIREGERFHKELSGGSIKSALSKDDGLSWNVTGEVPIPQNTIAENFHEPHAAELPSGKIVGLIRYQHSADLREYDNFSIFMTESHDSGKTWSQARPLGVSGSPPHLLVHSSKALICVYGYRKQPYGERAMISYDEGRTWVKDIILRDDGPDGDLGYPASVELDDESIFTVYYQKYKAGENPSLLWTRWKLPRE